MNELIRQNWDKMNTRMREAILKIYFSSPPKVQSALAKYVMKNFMNKKNHNDLKEIIRH